MTNAEIIAQAPQVSTVKSVHGDRYRWNFTHAQLELLCLELHGLSWVISAYTAKLRPMLQGEEYSGLDADRPRTVALYEQFRPLVNEELKPRKTDIDR
jgi:hypothetical protein